MGIFQCSGVGQVFHVNRLYRDTPFKHRQYMPVEVGELWIIISVVGGKTLKHQRIAHQCTDPF